jgi:hypothetical protein
MRHTGRHCKQNPTWLCVQQKVFAVCLSHGSFELVFDQSQIDLAQVHTVELMFLSPVLTPLPLSSPLSIFGIPLPVVAHPALVVGPKREGASRGTFARKAAAYKSRADFYDDILVFGAEGATGRAEGG